MSMKAVHALFDDLGGPAAVARALGVNPSTASEMKRRGSIPGEYWEDIVRDAEQRGLANVTLARIASIHASQRVARRPSREVA